MRAVLAALGGAEPVTVLAAATPSLSARIDGVVLR